MFSTPASVQLVHVARPYTPVTCVNWCLGEYRRRKRRRYRARCRSSRRCRWSKPLLPTPVAPRRSTKSHGRSTTPGRLGVLLNDLGGRGLSPYFMDQADLIKVRYNSPNFQPGHASDLRTFSRSLRRPTHVSADEQMLFFLRCSSQRPWTSDAPAEVAYTATPQLGSRSQHTTDA